MTRPTFTVIEGGLSVPKNAEEKKFVGAYITDTRLMGVTGLYIHWKLSERRNMVLKLIRAFWETMSKKSRLLSKLSLVALEDAR